MINDMKESGETTRTEVDEVSSSKSQDSDVLDDGAGSRLSRSRSSSPKTVHHQIETDFDLDPLPEREDFHWFSSSNNDISLTNLRNSVFLAARRGGRHPHKSIQVDTSHVLIPSNPTRKTNSVVTFAATTTTTATDSTTESESEEQRRGKGLRRFRGGKDKICNCAHQSDCSRSNRDRDRDRLHFTCNNFGDEEDKICETPRPLQSQRRAISLPEKVWAELMARSRKKKSKSKISRSEGTSARSSVSPTSTLFDMESTTTGSENNPGYEQGRSRSPSGSSSSGPATQTMTPPLKKIENVSDGTNGSEAVTKKSNRSSRSTWKFFTKGFKRSTSAGPNSEKNPHAVMQEHSPSPVMAGASSTTKTTGTKDFRSRKQRPMTLGDTGSVANFFRSFRVKKNKVGSGKPPISALETLVTSTIPVVDTDDKDDFPEGQETSNFALRRARGGFGGRAGVNTNIFSSFYQAGRKHFSPKDLDDVTLDLSSGELMKTNDGTVIEKADVVDVVETVNEGNVTTAKKTKLKTRGKKKKKVVVVAVAMTLPPSKSPASSSSSSLRVDQGKESKSSDINRARVEENTTTTKTSSVDYSDLYAKDDKNTQKNAGCELLSSSVGGGGGGDSSTASSTTNSSRGSQTEHFLSQQHLQREQNQHLRLSQTAAEDEERENSFTATQQPKTLFGKVKDFGSKSRRRLSSKPSSGSLANGLGPRNDSPFNFDETRKSNGDGNEGDEDGREGRGSSSNEMTPYRSKAVDIVGGVGRNSSEEELTSITNSQSGGLGSLSLSETEEYNGPFVGRALAVVDCMPSPYDRHALRYKKGDLIEIISKKPTGLWTGKVNGQVGHFKFINVEILPDESDGEEEEMEDEASNMYERPGDHRNRQAHSYLPVRRRNKRMTAMTPWEMEQRQTVANVINGIRKENAALSQHSKSLDSESPFRAVQSRTGRRKSSAAAASLKKGRPKSVGDLLRRINLEEYISVFILHGFESLDLFKELEEEDLDRLAISNPSDRAKILTIVELLREFDSEAEIPPIIIPTYSCPSQLDGMDVADPEGSDLHQIIAPPDSFTRTSGAGGQKFGTIVRDSGVFVKCDDQEDPEIEEIILSPVNLRIDASPCRNYDGSSTNMNPSSIFLGRLSNPNPGNMKQFPARSFPSSQAYPETGENIPMSTKTNDQWTDNVEQYCAVRQRFLQAKSLFESGVTSPGGTPQGLDVGGPNSQKNRFLFCEKSSDSGISVGANSPPPNRNE